MGVTLNYMLCPRSNAADFAERAWTDQLLMGLALKTLHDYPYIDDTTTVPTAGPPDARHARGHARPQQPAARAAAADAAGRGHAVLAGGLAADAPRRVLRRRARRCSSPTRRRSAPAACSPTACTSSCAASRSSKARATRISFTIPGETAAARSGGLARRGGLHRGLRSLRRRSAKATRPSLFLNHRDFAEPVEVDAAWNLATDGSVLKATARPMAGAQAIVPGIYGALVRTTARRTLPDGSQRDFEFWSNEVPLAIAPRIVNVAFVAGLGTITVDSFDPAPLSDNELHRVRRRRAPRPRSGRAGRRPVPPPHAGSHRVPPARRHAGRHRRCHCGIDRARRRVRAALGDWRRERGLERGNLRSLRSAPGRGARRAVAAAIASRLAGEAPGELPVESGTRLAQLAALFGAVELEDDVIAVLWVCAFDPELRASVLARDRHSLHLTQRGIAELCGHPARVRLASESPLRLWRLVEEHPLMDGTAALSHRSAHHRLARGRARARPRLVRACAAHRERLRVAVLAGSSASPRGSMPASSRASAGACACQREDAAARHFAAAVCRAARPARDARRAGCVARRGRACGAGAAPGVSRPLRAGARRCETRSRSP